MWREFVVLFWKTKIRKTKENLRFSNISTQYSLKNLDSREELTEKLFSGIELHKSTKGLIKSLSELLS